MRNQQRRGCRRPFSGQPARAGRTGFGLSQFGSCGGFARVAGHCAAQLDERRRTLDRGYRADFGHHGVTVAARCAAMRAEGNSHRAAPPGNSRMVAHRRPDKRAGGFQRAASCTSKQTHAAGRPTIRASGDSTRHQVHPCWRLGGKPIRGFSTRRRVRVGGFAGGDLHVARWPHRRRDGRHATHRHGQSRPGAGDGVDVQSRTRAIQVVEKPPDVWAKLAEVPGFSTSPPIIFKDTARVRTEFSAR